MPSRFTSTLQLILVGLSLCLVAVACKSDPSRSAPEPSGVESVAWYPSPHPEMHIQDLGEGQGGLVTLPDDPGPQMLNPVGFRVLSAMDGTKTPEEIARAISDLFKVEYETALPDVYQFLGELEEKGMLEDPIPEQFRERAGLQP